MSKARTLANLISDNAELADGQISVAEVVGAAPTASPTFTGNIDAGDNVKIRLGDGDDLQIYHDGSSSIIQDNGTGHLRLHAGSLRIRNSANTEAMISADEDGAVDLYHNNNLKLATTSSGINVTGTAVTDGLTVAGNVSVDGGTIKLDGNYPVGTDNVALGNTALDSNVSGIRITAVGSQALTANTASDNTAVGARAMLSTTSGANNVAIGRDALYTNTSGADNVSVGLNSLFSNSTGSYNTSLGRSALQSNTTASNNTAVGYLALTANTTASNNTAVGWKAGYANTTGTITATGRTALENNTTGTENTATGRATLAQNTTGSYNTAHGALALGLSTTASKNTAVGYQAGYNNTTDFGITALGHQALYSNTTGSGGSFNTALGVQSLYTNTTGYYNLAVGHTALYTNNGNFNVAIGKAALYSNTTASNNTAVGYQAGYLNTTGFENTFVGNLAGYSNTTGILNTFIGRRAGHANTTSQRNTFVGHYAGNSVNSSSNTFIGQDAGNLITSGGNNTIIGKYTGNQHGLDIRTASNNIVLSDGDGNPRLHFNELGNAYTNGTLDLSATFSTTTSMKDVLKINSSSTGSAGVGHGSAIYFLGERNDGNTQAMARIGSIATTNSGTSFASALVFHAGAGGAPSERMRIGSSGNLLVGTTTTGWEASRGTGYVASDGYWKNTTNTSSQRAHWYFGNSNGWVGQIYTSGSSTTYSTSSDHRLKENVEYTWDATTRLKQLKPARFNFIADADTTVDGFLAHEAQAVVPESVSGTHNEVEVWKESDELPDGVSAGDNKLDDDGNTIPVMQGIDQSKLVPLLVKTIQELEARITALEGA